MSNGARRKSRDVTLLVYGQRLGNKTALVRRSWSLGGDHYFSLHMKDAMQRLSVVVSGSRYSPRKRRIVESGIERLIAQLQKIEVRDIWRPKAAYIRSTLVHLALVLLQNHL